MQRYPWPGNVRELENCLERAVVLCRSILIGPDDLPPVLHKADAVARTDKTRRDADLAAGELPLDVALAESEKQIIQAALAVNDGSRQATAKQLRIDRTTLYKKMKRHGLMG